MHSCPIRAELTQIPLNYPQKLFSFDAFGGRIDIDRETGIMNEDLCFCLGNSDFTTTNNIESGGNRFNPADMLTTETGARQILNPGKGDPC